jgi:hypothetical protein
MRTTLTLDDDVAAALERLRKTSQASWKELVNQALREGLRQMRAGPRRREPFRTQGVSLGRPLIGSLDNVAEALAAGEGEAFR